MNHNKIRLSIEISLGKELKEIIQGDILDQIIKEAQIEKIESNWKHILEGHSFKLGKELAPDLFDLCIEVQHALEFSEPIDFYITNSSELNAFSLSRTHNDTNHIVNLNSALVEKFDDEELKFVIGHEIGHLISGNAHITMLLQFVYNDLGNMPLMLRHKFNLWQKVSELTADRFGYMVCQNHEKVLSSFFKMSSGLSSHRISFDSDLFIQENDKKLEYFKKSVQGDLFSHPINPIRVKSIDLYSKSDTYKKAGEIESEDEALAKQMQELLEIIQKVGGSKLDYHRKIFIASAGIILAQVDEEMNLDEYKALISTLSEFTIFPKVLLEEISKQDVVKLCNESIQEILNINPSERYALLDYVIQMALSDHHIFSGELDLIYRFGDSMSLPKKEVAQLIASGIQKRYVPNIF